MVEDGYHQSHGHRCAWGRMTESDVGRNAEHSGMNSKIRIISNQTLALNLNDAH